MLDDTDVRQERRHWYALYTRARHEKKVDQLLRMRHFEVFLPLVPRQRQWHDRRKVVEWPLFPGYVFARFPLASTSEVLGTPGVATVVRQDGLPAPIRETEIENVRRFAALLSGTGEIPEPTPLIREGQRVRITKGAFRGVTGSVVQRRGGGKVLIQIGVETIGQGIKIEVEAKALQNIAEVD
jgi:transcription antitermination factor NusG